MFQTLVKNRAWLFVRGIAAIAFGVLAIIWPGVTLLALVILIGAYALIDGISALVLVFRGRHARPRNIWPLILVAIGGIGTAIITVLWPAITALALLVLFAGWSIVRGVFEVWAAVRLRKEMEGEWLLGAAGVLSVVVGVLLIAWPGAGLLALVWLMAFYAILVGIVYISLGYELGHPGKPLRHAPAS